MCFSPEADLAGGLVLTVIGVDALRHLPAWHGHRIVASLPLLFAAHQLDEAVVWWALQGHVPREVGRVAVWAYLLFAFVVLPTFVPLAVHVLEPSAQRRRFIAAFAVLGGVVSAVLFRDMLRGPLNATLGDYHVAYSTTPTAGGLVVAAYVVATCGSLLFSSYRDIAIFGIINLVAVVLLAQLTIDGFASLWCGWAAITSGAIALHLRFAQPRRRPARAIS